MHNHASVCIALPVMNESELLPLVLHALEQQRDTGFHVVVCVNQPDEWWNDPLKRHVCLDNAQTLTYLRSYTRLPITLIDKSSRGYGWTGKHHGVGWARKTALDRASQMAGPGDLLVSFDADTLVNNDYIGSLQQAFSDHPLMNALSVPYYHRLTGDEPLDRAMLRYEIYMRYYAVNLWRIKNPHAFSALGSAIVVRNRVYKAVKGISPRLSGEDFYFLQKLVKFGGVGHWCKSWVYPATRTSSRVFFGTGPALIQGLTGDWNSYPFYLPEWFSHVEATFNAFPLLFEKDVQTPMSGFLGDIFGRHDWWAPLRGNYITPDSFTRACAEKIDGLRVLQYLKEMNRLNPVPDNLQVVKNYIARYFPDHYEEISGTDPDYTTENIARTDNIRNVLAKIETGFRQKSMTALRNN